MSNVFQQSLQTIADRRFSDDPQLLSNIWQLRQRLRSGHFERGLVDAFVQTYTGTYDLYDTFGFAMLWSALIRGNICYAVLEFGHECSSDRDVETNRGLLSALNLIRGPDGSTIRCEADFWGGLSDSDGFFRWLDPLRFQRRVREASGTEDTSCECDTLCVEKGKLPLEVGTTHAATTYAHIFSEHGLARWPYNSKHIYLFYAPLISPGLVSFCRVPSANRRAQKRAGANGGFGACPR